MHFAKDNYLESTIHKLLPTLVTKTTEIIYIMLCVFCIDWTPYILKSALCVDLGSIFYEQQSDAPEIDMLDDYKLVK